MIFGKKKKETFDVTDFIDPSNEEILKELFSTGDYSLTMERVEDIVNVVSSRELKIGDFIEIMVNIIMIAPEHSRKDLITVITYIVKTLQKKDERLLH